MASQVLITINRKNNYTRLSTKITLTNRVKNDKIGRQICVAFSKITYLPVAQLDSAKDSATLPCEEIFTFNQHRPCSFCTLCPERQTLKVLDL